MSVKLDFGKLNILWCNLSGAFVNGMDSVCPIRAVACLDDGADFDLISARSGVRFLSHEQTSGRRVVARDTANDDIVHFLADRMKEALSSSPKYSWRIVCPRPTRALEVFASENGCEGVSHSASLCEWLNDKRNFFRARDELGLPGPHGRWLSLSSTSYDELRAEFTSRVVLQAARGSTGSGTAIVESQAELATAAGWLGTGPIWCAPFLGHLSLNINAIATECGVIVSYPSVQLTGLPLLGARFGKYCGNDFTATASLGRSLIEEAQRQTERLGEWLGSIGYRGIFGLDFVIEDATGSMVAVDLNPRWQGSSMLETTASIRAGRTPLPTAELAYRVGALGARDLQAIAETFRRPLEGSQMILVSLHERPVLIRNHVRPGIYRVDGSLNFVREAADLTECRSEDDVLLTCAVVRAGTTIEPSARAARVVSLRAAIDPHRHVPCNWARVAVHGFFRLFRLPVPREFS